MDFCLETRLDRRSADRKSNGCGGGVIVAAFVSFPVHFSGNAARHLQKPAQTQAKPFQFMGDH
jgi:hypothetical protein